MIYFKIEYIIKLEFNTDEKELDTMEIMNTQNNGIIETLNYRDLLNEFLRDKAGKSRKTQETYLKNIRAFLVWIREKGNPAITKSLLIEYEAFITNTYKPTTARAYFNNVKMWFSWLYNEGVIEHNPAANVQSGAKITRDFKKAYLTEDQARELILSVPTKTAKGKRDLAIILICLCCGLRTIELERANIEDMKETAFGKVLYIQGKGCKDKSQLVKLPGEVYTALLNYLETRGIKESDLEKNGSEPLFVSEASNHIDHRLNKESISRLVKGYLRGIGLNSSLYTVHSLRHTAATLNLLNGGTLEETQQLLRHANIETTMIYNHSLERAKNESENRLAKLLINH